MPPEPAVRVPRLGSTQVTMWLSVAFGLLALPGVLVWAFLTQSRSDAWIGAAGVSLVAIVLGALVSRGHRLDTESGDLVRTVLGSSKRIPWSGAQVAVVPNGGGLVLLQVRTPGAAATYLPLAAVGPGGERCQEPGFLRLLADEVERWGAHSEVASLLRAQADHVAAGGQVPGSPLVRHGLSA